MSRAKKAKPAPAPELLGADVVFECFTARSLIGRELVHLEREHLAGLCGADLFKSWQRYPDTAPTRRFKMCAACLKASNKALPEFFAAPPLGEVTA